MTQVKTLRSGTKNQILNPEVDYSVLPKATSHNGHSGSNQKEVEQVWERIKDEHPESMNVIVNGIEVKLTANWSGSRKSVSYDGSISIEDLESKFNIKAAKTGTPSISVQRGNIIMVSNGKKSFRTVCPSLVEII